MVVNISMKTPIGAHFIASRMMYSATWFTPSSSSTMRAALSGLICVRAMPTRMLVKITASMLSFSTNTLSGLAGMTATNVSMPNGFFLPASTLSADSFPYFALSRACCAFGNWSPGRMAFTSPSPMTAANRVVMRK